MKRGAIFVSTLLLAGGVIACGFGASAAAPDPGPPADGRAVRADSLHRAAAARLAVGGIDARRVALRELQDAVLLAPDEPRHRLAYGRACLEAGFDQQARVSFERAAALDPRDGAARLGLGQVWKRDWLRLLDDASLTKAIAHLSAAVELDPGLCDAWVLLASLLFEHGEVDAALEAAERACATCPDRADAQLARAYLSYRSGQLERAEGSFEDVLARLPRATRARFEDLAPLLTPEDGEALQEMSAAERAEFERRFWSEADPDPATSENEARLEFRARVAHASLVFQDPTSPGWDARAELYVRYGAPGQIAYQPDGSALAHRPNKFDNLHGDRYGNLHRIGSPMWYPMRSQTWEYPGLGMSVVLQDHGLLNHYQFQTGRYTSTDPVPDPRALARSDLLATAGGRAVFPVLPPGVKPLKVQGSITHFEVDGGVKLLAQIEVPGTPGDSIWAQCVVVDSSEHEFLRASRVLSPSGCDPTTLRTGDFALVAPPGRYRVAFSVRDGRGARGVARAIEEVGPVPAALSLSDVVVTCGPIDVAREVPAVRLGPNLNARVSGDGPLIAYFEVYRLTPGADGQSRFEYEYIVRSAERDTRPWYQRVLPFGGREPHYDVRSEAVNLGPLRRQFVSVPVQLLPPGYYRLEVRVRDLNTGATAAGSTNFERVGGAVSGG